MDKSVHTISDKLVKKLNKIKSVKNFPSQLKPPTLNKKISIVSRQATGGKSAIANNLIYQGEVICDNDGTLINKAIKYSWQIDEVIHQIGPGALDHTCSNPACGMDSNNRFIALRNIKKGEYITFNYLTTEYKLSAPFICSCGSKNCYKEIKGFKFLSRKNKLSIPIENTSNYIKSKIKEL